MESRSPFKGLHTLDESMSIAERSEIACVYTVQNTAATLETNIVFDRTAKNIDECVVEIVRKTTRLLELIGTAKKNTLAKKC